MVSLSEMFPHPGVHAKVSGMLDAPRGIVAFTGGDGSGKSTSLFAFAQELRTRGKPCTVLIQDPHLERVLQPAYFEGHDVRRIENLENLQQQLDMAAAKGIVIIDELDYRNVRQLVDLAKAGATVFTMIHTPFVGIDCAYTLQKMGIDPAEFLEVFSCLASQMLAPSLCPHCREPVTIDVAQAQAIDPAAREPMTVWKEVGCSRCKQEEGPRRGTIGMLALHEVLLIDEQSRPVLAAYLEDGDLRNPLPPGHVTMQEDARELVRRGELGFATYKREVTQNPTLRMQHQWELERRHGENIAERLTKLRRFFSPAVAELILSGSVDDPLKTRRREIVVAFLDLRGFTAFAETSDPEDVMRVLGDYHAAMGALVMAHGATLERFAGDGMMVFLNDPVQVDEPARDAVLMATHMQRKFDEVRKGWRKLGIDLTLGIGVAQGYATIGAIGFEGRRDYGAIGVVTNLAARLCAEAKGGQILLSQRVYGAIEEQFTAEPIGPLSLKGFHAPVEAFSVQWRDGP